MNANLEMLKKDPRLESAAKNANCSKEEFFARLCKNSGIRFLPRNV